MSIALRPAVVKAVRLKSSVRIMSQDCNLKIHNALRRNFRERNRRCPLPGPKTARPRAPGLVKTAFVIIGLRCDPLEWRYRLGVRTEDSQSSNPGSIPGSATKPSFEVEISSNSKKIILV